MKRIVIAALVVGVLVAGGIAYQSLVLKAAEPQQGARPQPAVPVVIAAVEKKPMPVRVDAIGTVQPIASVAVRARIDAQIAEVKVADGQEVKAGDVLIVLDTRAAAALLHQAEANMARDRAQLENARRDVDRLRPLTQKDFVSRQQFDLTSTNAVALEAAVKADEASVDNFRVLLTYYTIAAPMDGRVGTVMLKVGNTAKSNDTQIMTLNQFKPIYVSFSVAQRELPGIRSAMAAGDVAVSVQVPNDPGGPIKGKVTFIDNAIDIATGTIALKATFPNDDERLWPGQFVNVQMTVRVEPDAIVAPAAAVQNGQNGSYVFVVKPDNTAEVRPVVISRTIDNETVFAKGLAEGDRVVIDGQLRLTNGTRVDIRTSAQPKPKTERNS